MCKKLSNAIRRQNQRGSLAVIAELKSRRFRGADLFRGRGCSDIARTYATAGATALSVVTSPWFGGSMRMLEEVAAADLGLPILRKDLIATQEAVRASKRAGASAVLLVLPLLGRERLLAMLEAALGEGLEPFVEVATLREIEELREHYDGVIAINNADVKTNEVEGADIYRSLSLIDRSDPRIWISASRIASEADVTRLSTAGFNGILIGTHLLLSDDLESSTKKVVAAARLKEPVNSNPVIKVCGVTSEKEVQLLADLGVDFFGLVVDVPSPWSISRDRAAQLAACSNARTRATLVTKPQPVHELARTIAATGVTAVQLGTLTSPGYVQQLRKLFSPAQLTILQQISYRHGEFWKEEQAAGFVEAGADFILLDTLKRGNERDSTPIPAQELARFRTRNKSVPLLVAGGVSAENVRELMAASGAAGIDVCGSVRLDGAINRKRVSDLMGRLISTTSDDHADSPVSQVRPSLRKALASLTGGNQVVAYLTLGDPGGSETSSRRTASAERLSVANQVDSFGRIAAEVIDGGAVALELGFPHPEPLEGPVLSASHRRALAAGVDMSLAMTMLKSIAQSHPDIPLVGVVQWSSISQIDERYRFLDQLADAGAAAVLPVGLPLWQLPGFAAEVHRRDLETVISCFPTASRTYRGLVMRYCSGCIYVARGRQTGNGRQFPNVEEFCTVLASETDLPLIVGVGVKNSRDVAQICNTPAKAAAVGSALAEHIANGGSPRAFLHTLLSS